MQEESLLAVNDDDLADLLRAIGYLDKIEAGEVFCIECNTLITIRNLQLILPLANMQFSFVCNAPGCVQEHPSH